MLIRTAALTDMEDIKRLLDDLNRSSTELLPRIFKIAQTTNEQVERLINDKNCEIIIAEKDGKIIGLIEMHLVETKNKPVLIKKSYIYIQNLIVDEEVRGEGVGKTLIDAAKNWGIKHGVKYCRLSVIPDNESAIAFYNKEGFSPIMYSMEIEIKN